MQFGQVWAYCVRVHTCTCVFVCECECECVFRYVCVCACVCVHVCMCLLSMVHLIVRSYPRITQSAPENMSCAVHSALMAQISISLVASIKLCRYGSVCEVHIYSL